MSGEEESSNEKSVTMDREDDSHEMTSEESMSWSTVEESSDQSSPIPPSTNSQQSSIPDAEAIKQSVGSGTAHLSDFINENLVAVRYASIATIGLLAAYGISQTPLFFRYRTVAELPPSYFRGRKSIRGRLIRTVQNETADEPIRCYVRHLSPMERLLSKSLYDWVMKIHPASVVGRRPDESSRELLLCEIAGIRSPPTDYLSYTEQPGEWIQRLAKDRPLVSCQLLARRVTDDDADESRPKRKIPEFQESSSSTRVMSEDQIAICKIYYRPKIMQLFATDVAESMVGLGQASVAEDGLYAHNNDDERIIDTTDCVKDLRKDAAYLHHLSQAEYKAAAGSYGMWADASVRERHKDIVEEVEFQSQASVWQKLWRWIRGG